MITRVINSMPDAGSQPYQCAHGGVGVCTLEMAALVFSGLIYICMDEWVIKTGPTSAGHRIILPSGKAGFNRIMN